MKPRKHNLTIGRAIDQEKQHAKKQEEAQAWTYLARIALILTVDLPDQLEPHFTVDLDVGDPLGGLEIARNSLLIGLLGDNLEEFPPHAFALGIWSDGDDIAEVVALRVGPDFLLRL
jgi:hypothetical protein